MKMIHPVTEEQCRPHCGKTIVAVMHDGTEITGVLSEVKDGKLYLNSEQSVQTNRAGKKKKSVKKSGRKGQAKLNAASYALYPAFPAGPAIVLDLALIALLFVLI
ncbi:hypothetical protein [Paenibacillus hamazuiensis]|uniref:hypothetical protein n=1 Tax=Paenibacillus hamazuiensis TaxID=2936508 RepID=UPI00200D46CD|nr:hypothetical protein [Paenibacillus hamazuiensis]